MPDCTLPNPRFPGVAIRAPGVAEDVPIPLTGIVVEVSVVLEALTLRKRDRTMRDADIEALVEIEILLADEPLFVGAKVTLYVML